MWTGSFCLNNNSIILFFELINLCTILFLWTVCLFTNVYKFIVPLLWKLTFLERKFLFIHLSQREKKRHRIVRKAQTLYVSSLCYRSFYLERQMFVSLKAPQIVWGVKTTLRRSCQTQDLIWIIHHSRIWYVSF